MTQGAMHVKMARRELADKYDLKEILYGTRELYRAIREMPGIDYEKSSLRKAILLLAKTVYLRAKIQEDGTYTCPHCGFPVDNYYCPNCGQAIYWKRNVRPNDERRRDHEYRSNKSKDFDYINLQERREIDWYIRIRGLYWVLDKLRAADTASSQDTFDKNEIRDMFKQSIEKGESL